MKKIFYIIICTFFVAKAQTPSNMIYDGYLEFCSNGNSSQSFLGPNYFCANIAGDSCIINSSDSSLLIARFGTIDKNGNSAPCPSYKNYNFQPLKIALSEPTIPGCEYEISYKLKSTNSFSCNFQVNYFYYRAQINNISILFSNVNSIINSIQICYDDFNFNGNIDTTFLGTSNTYIPQIHFSTGIIDDTDWYNFNGTFIADSIYNYVYMGYFDSFYNLIYEMDSINPYMQPTTGINSFIDYFLDSIEIFPVAPDGYTSFNDTILCDNNLHFNAFNLDFTSYLWSTGDTTNSIEINTPGTYWLRADYACGYLTDTFTVHPAPILDFDSLLPYSDTLLICPSELPFTLSVLDSIGSVNWNTGDFAESITIQSEGLYTASYENCDTILDSVWVILQEPENIDLFSFTDTTACNEFSIAVADTFQSYLWSNGSTSNEAIFTESGTISLTVNDGCFDYTDSFNLVIDQLVTGAFAEHRYYCPQDFPITLSVSSFDQPVWNTGEQSSSITLSSPQSGTFIHTSENTCGVRSDTFHIHLQTDTLGQLPQISIEEQCVEQGLYHIITEVFDDNFSYQWEGQTSLNFSTTGGSTETLTISNECASFSIDTDLNACPERIVFALPTAFSPNSDGVNDQFGLLYLRDDYVLFKLQIFNRWGELVFVSENIQNKWNGFYKDKAAPIGVYIYQLLIVSNGGEEELHSGNVTLVR